LSTAETLWAAVADHLRSELNDAVWLSTFAGVKTTATHSEDGGTHVQLEVPSVIAKDRINNRYHAMVQDALIAVCGSGATFDVTVHVSESELTMVDPLPLEDLVTQAPTGPGQSGSGPSGPGQSGLQSPKHHHVPTTRCSFTGTPGWARPTCCKRLLTMSARTTRHTECAT